MVEVTIKRGLKKSVNVKLYDNIKEMPVLRYQEFQKALVQLSGIGSDMDAIAKHFSVFHELLNEGEAGKAWAEARNLHNNLFQIIEGISIHSFAFIALIESIDGVELTEISQTEYDRLFKTKLKRLKQYHVEETISSVKKKLKANFNPHFLLDSALAETLTFMPRLGDEAF